MSLGHIALLPALTIFAVAVGELLDFHDCGREKGRLLTVDMSPCPKKPCRLVRGRTFTVNVTFTSGEVTPYCKASAYGLVLGIGLPIPLPEADGCKSGVVCPLKEGATYNYLSELPIKAEYPKVVLDILWNLKDAEYKDLFCWIIPVRIVDG
ncbi:NPC intracellular cholesterol transporter 2-like isoform X2 [Rana temporaria]|nr:NPC intracellular cholesterol transporter 2-like isoform X2 [Rana temporaria]XP_040190457.1 NPC intracellular cholesterol transporter 2-like isoform X2 [Rana temporaria]